MEELIARVTQKTGLDQATARRPSASSSAYLQKEGPPGRGEPADRGPARRPGGDRRGEDGGNGGGLMGMMGSMGGGVMALGGQLMGAGVSMGQMQPLGQGALRLWPREGGRGRDGPHRRLDPGTVAVR